VRRSGDAWVRRWWRGEAGLVGAVASLAALPLEALFRLGAGVRGAAFDRGMIASTRVDAPVLSVGNLTVGGTGKTPLVRWFVRALGERGRRPGIAARGYGRDEILLHRRWHPDVPVAANPDRVAAARAAIGQGADVVVLDDAFQHRRLARDLDVVLVDAETPFPGRRLPRGPYREGPGALSRADVVIVTRRSASADRARQVSGAIRARHPRLPVARVALVPGGWQDLAGRALPPDGPGGGAGTPAEGPVGTTVPSQAPHARPVAPAVITAVAQPGSVRTLAARALDRPEASMPLVAFPDHHEFAADDLRPLAARHRDWVVTEKDAVKLAEHAELLTDVRVRVLGLRLVWEEGLDVVDTALDALGDAWRAEDSR
jgi:tetraacyldisaccharide 4'-kinase